MIDVEKIENLALRAGDIRGVENEPYHVLRNTEGAHSLVSAEQFLDHPVRIRRELEVHSVDSFVRYFNTWKDCSAIYSDLEATTVEGILDDHRTDAGGVEGEIGPSWCTHRVRYKCEFSRQWNAWMDRDGDRMDQQQFAEHLEDRIEDISEPAGADLLELATRLQIVRRASFGSQVKLSSGEVTFSYSEENTTGTIELPTEFKLGIPVFRNGTAYAITARLRYRLDNGKLGLWYQVADSDKYIEDAFTEVTGAIATGTEVNALQAGYRSA